MKNLLFLLAFFFVLSSISYAQLGPGCEGVSIFKKSSHPDLGIVLYTNDAEAIWNAFRLAIYSQEQGDTVAVFVLGKAVEVFMADTTKYNILDLSMKFFMNGGHVYACATCAKQRNTEDVQTCTITSIKDLYLIVRNSKKLLTF